MKKFIALFLALVLCIGLVACGNPGTEQPTNSPAPVEPSPVPSEPANPSPAPEQPSAEPVNAAANAIAYIKNVYKKAAEITGKDFQRIGTVPVGDEKVVVVWTVDVAEDLVKVVVGEDGMVTIDVNEGSTEEVPYVLTATVTGADGKSESLSWNHILPATMDVDGLTYAEIVDMAYALEDQISTEDAFRLYGTVTSIDTPWSEDYQNITVTIVVAGKEEQPIQCYRLKGEGAKDLKVGDQITVEGILKNYKGTYEFDAGCQLIGYGEHVDQKALLKAAFALGEGVAMDYPSVLTGVITEIPTAWSDEYGNITVNFQVEDKVVMAYRLKGEGAKDLAVGQTITVAGSIKNYKGTIEYDQGCVLVPNDLYHSVKNALSGYKLLDGEAQEATKTITGTISAIDTPWSEDYQNITVTVIVGGLENYPIMCYRLKGEGASTLAVGDVITVTGTLKNYKGTIEFDAGCTLDALGTSSPAEAVDPNPSDEPVVEPVVAPTNPAEIVDAAYALESGASLPYSCTLTGTVVTIDTPYSEQYGNITVSIAVAGKEDKPIMCFRLKGDGAADLAVGNIITVTGTIKNYNGTIEFDSGCTVDAVVSKAAATDTLATAILGAWTDTATGYVLSFTETTYETLQGEAVVNSWTYVWNEDGTMSLTDVTGVFGTCIWEVSIVDGRLIVKDQTFGLSYDCTKN